MLNCLQALLTKPLNYLAAAIIRNFKKMKQGEEKTQFVKEEEEKTRHYIFQKNSKTKLGFYFTLAVLVLLIIGVAVSGILF